MNKETHDLVDNIKVADNIDNYMEENSDEFINMDLAEYLNKLLSDKGLNRHQVFAQGNITKSYGDHILNGRREKPSRDIILRFCFGLGLDIDQSQRLLRMARVGSLYARDRRDSVILFCLEKKKTVVECDLLLHKRNLTILANSELTLKE